jgi:hypothetical protein
MMLRFKALTGLLCLAILLTACGPQANPAATAEPTQTAAAANESPTVRPTRTPRPTGTPRHTPTPGEATGTAEGTSASTEAGASNEAGASTEAGAATQAGTPAADTPAGANTPAAPGAATAAGNPPPAAGKAMEKYTYLGPDIPDRTQFLPNRQVTITWTVKNTGTTGWTKAFTLRYFAGPKPNRDAYSFTKDVPVNDTINFVVTFTTPAAPGDYDLWFKLTNAANQNFGDLDLVFTVSNNPVKAPTATQTK